MALVVGVDCQAKLIKIKLDVESQDASVYIIVCLKFCRFKELRMRKKLATHKDMYFSHRKKIIFSLFHHSRLFFKLVVPMVLLFHCLLQ
jgi:hypothetical protein